MRALKLLFLLALAAASLCLAPPVLAADEAPLADEAKQAERTVRLKIADDGLAKLYGLQPETQATVEGAVGHAVFEVDSIYAVLLVGQRGKGVLYDREAKKHTFMVSTRLGTGPGLGKQRVFQVFVFKTQTALDQFVLAGGAGGDIGASVSTGTGGMFEVRMSLSSTKARMTSFTTSSRTSYQVPTLIGNRAVASCVDVLPVRVHNAITSRSCRVTYR